jgi:hypothetical protein
MAAITGRDATIEIDGELVAYVPFMTFTVPVDFRSAMASIGDAAGNVPSDHRGQQRLAYRTARGMFARNELSMGMDDPQAVGMLMERTGLPRECCLEGFQRAARFQIGMPPDQRDVIAVNDFDLDDDGINQPLGILRPVLIEVQRQSVIDGVRRQWERGAMPAAVITPPPAPNPVAKPQSFERPKRRINLG